jgi:glycolate oxidase iron-sulfur subunit
MTTAHTPHSPGAPLFQGVEFDDVLKCVHCGLCLNACPTYRELDVEQDSPRGRLYLMRGLWEGKLGLDDQVVLPLSRCLDCRACETACPSNVPYGELLEKTRGVIAEHREQSNVERFLRGALLRRLLGSTSLLTLVSVLMRLYQRSGLARVVSWALARLGWVRLSQAHALMPAFSGRSFKQKNGGRRLEPKGAVRNHQRVALFTGCVLDVAEAEIHEASIQLLRAIGFGVEVPPLQGCCGALQVHAGERETARELALKNLWAFDAASIDWIIANSSGCCAQLREYGALFDDDQARWKKLGARVVDVLEFISRWPDAVSGLSWKRDPVVVLYDAPCHLVHAQRVDKNPRELLSSLPGVQLVPIDEAEACCGAAGIYNLTQPELSRKVLERKVLAIKNTLAREPEAALLVSGNVGCINQIRYGLGQRRVSLRVVHPVVFMAERLKD